MLYALIKNGTIAEYRVAQEELPLDGIRQIDGLYVLRPVVDIYSEITAEERHLIIPEITIEDARILRTYFSRPITNEELQERKDLLLASVETAFQTRCKAPIAYLDYSWHADDEAVQNIMGVVLLIAVGAPVPNPRPWTPVGQLTPISLTHAQLIGLGGLIAYRKDVLFVIKKQKQAEVSLLTTMNELNSYDVDQGWE